MKTISVLALLKSVIPPFIPVSNSDAVHMLLPLHWQIGDKPAIHTTIQQLSFNWNQLLVVTWFLGFVGIIPYAVLHFRRLNSQFQNTEKIETTEFFHSSSEIRAYRSNFHHSPFLLGLLRPRIILPAGLGFMDSRGTAIGAVARAPAHSPS